MRLNLSIAAEYVRYVCGSKKVLDVEGTMVVVVVVAVARVWCLSFL